MLSEGVGPAADGNMHSVFHLRANTRSALSALDMEEREIRTSDIDDKDQVGRRIA